MSNIYVDPGKVDCGCALFIERRLRAAWLHPSERPLRDVQAFSNRVVCEIPQVYTHGKGKGDPNDLIDVTLSAGTVTAGMARKFYRPGQWKGQLPKNVMHERMWKLLDQDETQVLVTVLAPKRKTTKHGCLDDIYDAVCLGLRCEGRM